MPKPEPPEIEEAEIFEEDRPAGARADALTVELAPEGRALPRLRRDLEVRERQSGSGKVYELLDPVSRRLVALYAGEMVIARALDGTRDGAALVRLARDRGLAVSAAKLLKFVTMLHNSGFLEEPEKPAAPDLGRNEFSLMAPMPTASLSVTFPPAPGLRVAEAPGWSAEERALLQVALSLHRRGLGNEAENRLLALLEINPENVEARAVLDIVQRDRQRGLTLDDVAGGIEPDGAAGGPAALGAAAEPAEEELADRAEQELRRRLRRRTLLRTAVWVGLLAAATGVSAIVPYPLRARGNAVLLPRDRAIVRVATPGVIDAIPHGEGTDVSAGQPLAILYDRDLRTQLAQRQAEVQRAEAQLALLRRGTRPEEIQAARQVLTGRITQSTLQSRECEVLRTQVSQGIAPAEQLRNCDRELATLRAAVDEARARVALVSVAARPEELQQADAGLRRAAADLAEVKEKLELTVIRSPIAGRIITPRFEERLHEHLGAGDVLCEVARLDVMKIEVHVLEDDMDLPVLGAAVRSRFSSVPSRVFRSTVVEIGQRVEVSGSAATERRFVRVVSEVRNRDGVLRPGLTGYSDITARRTTVLGLVVRRIVRWFELSVLTWL